MLLRFRGQPQPSILRNLMVKVYQDIPFKVKNKFSHLVHFTMDKEALG